MNNAEFLHCFMEDLPDYRFMYYDYMNEGAIPARGSFIDYLVEIRFQLITEGKLNFGFDSDIYSTPDTSIKSKDSPSFRYTKSNRYVFNFLIKNKDNLSMLLL